MDDSTIVSGIGLVILLGALTRRPMPLGFIAALVISLSPAYGTFLVAGSGLITIVAVLAMLALLSRPWNQTSRESPPLGYPLFFLLMLSGLVAVRDLYDGNPPDSALTLAVVSLIMFFTALIGSNQQRDGLLKGFIVGGSLLASAEIIRVAQGGTQHAQTISFGVNPIVLGQFIAISLIASLMLLFRKPWSWGWFLLAVTSFIGILATGSRGPMMAALFASLLLIILRPNGRTNRSSTFLRLIILTYVILVLIIVITGFFRDVFADWWRLDDSDGNASSRWQAWEAAWSTLISHPVTGAGAGNYYFGESAVEYGLPSYPHQLFLEVGAEYGLPAALLLLASVIAVFRLSGKAGAPFVILAVVAFSFSGSINTTLVFGVCLALALVMNTHDNNPKTPLNEGLVPGKSMEGAKQHSVPRGQVSDNRTTSIGVGR